MAKINLLPWRDELREQRKKQFITFSAVVAILGIIVVALAWLFENHKFNDQEQANQLIVSTNKNIDTQLKSLDGLQGRRNAVVERMKLIQGLESQRPVVVRLMDELVRVTPSAMYLTKFTRVDDKFTIEGKAESPNTVAELLRNLESSSWYRNAFMNSFLAADDKKDQSPSSVVPRVEETYGGFVVTTDLGEIGAPVTQGHNNQKSLNAGAAQ